MKKSFFVFLCSALFFPVITFSQNIPQGSTVFIESDPLYPKPNEIVDLSLETYGVVFSEDDIRWYKDGIMIPETNGLRKITLSAPSYGTTTHITVFLGQKENSAMAEHIITPTVFDLIMEPLIKKSPFYEGKTFISEGTPIALIGSLFRGNKAQDYTYTWELVGTKGVIKGKRVVMPMPEYEKTLLIHVYDRSGNEVYSGGTTLTPVEPRILIYPFKDSIQGQRPVDTTYIPLEETEIFLISAYGLDAESVTWFVDDQLLSFSLSIPQLLTLTNLFLENTIIKAQIPYGPFDAFNAEKQFMITQ